MFPFAGLRYNVEWLLRSLFACVRSLHGPHHHVMFRWVRLYLNKQAYDQPEFARI